MEGIRAKFAQLLSLRKEFQESSVKLSELSRKDTNKSINAREKGNQLYTQKSNHDRDVHKNILSQYTKSIAFAPQESEELAKGYSNRSLILMHLQRYEESLIDIEKSMQITESDVLKSKLEARKEKCLKLIKDAKKKVGSKKAKTGKKNVPPKQSNEQLGIYKMTASSQMPTASEAIAASYNENFGRHIVATRDIKAGEVVLLERSFACVPKHSQVYLVCNHCLKFAWNAIPCINCAFAIYCSEECKKEAWEEYHEVECSILPYMSFVLYNEEGLMNSLMMAIRMLLKAIKDDGLDVILEESKANRKGLEGMIVDGKLQHNKFKSFYSLESHENSLRKLFQRKNLNESGVIELLTEHTNIFNAAKHSLDDTIEHETALQLTKILGKLVDIIKVNAFGYHGSICQCFKLGKSECDCDSSKGMIFATSASLINHSCAPNVSRMNLPKGKIAFFTFTPVKKGEQLFDSYGPTVGMPKKERKAMLEKHFFFTCECVSCQGNWLENGPVDYNMSQKGGEIIQGKVVNEFEKSFPRGLKSSLFTKEMNDWKFDEEQLKMALKMTDIVYKHYKSAEMCLMRTIQFRMYIDLAFNHLYGERASIPENCS